MRYRRRQIMQNDMITITGGDGSSEENAIGNLIEQGELVFKISKSRK